MYCGSTVLREVQLKVIEIEISGPPKENHYQGSSQGSRQKEHLAERQAGHIRSKVWGWGRTIHWAGSGDAGDAG